MSSTRENELHLSQQGEILRAILTDWIETGMPVHPRLSLLIAHHLGVSVREHWIAAMLAAEELTDQLAQENRAAPQLPMHPDYHRLHQRWGADRDYGMIGEPSLDMVP